MREHVIFTDLASDPVVYAEIRKKLTAMGWRFTEDGYLADPHYWMQHESGAWQIWQWEDGEPPHPAWLREMSRPNTPLLPDSLPDNSPH